MNLVSSEYIIYIKKCIGKEINNNMYLLNKIIRSDKYENNYTNY